MSMEIIAIISASTALAGLILNGQNSLRREIGSVRGEIGSVRGEIGSVREEIGDLREEIGGLRERMAHVEGLLEGLLREAFIGRRAAPAEAVAEGPGPYDKR